MRTFLLIVFSTYFVIMFMGSFLSWINSKSDREFWWRFIDTWVSIGMIYAFIKLIEVV